MPKGTRVGRCVDYLKHKYGYGPAIGICQKSTKQNYMTGKKMRKKTKKLRRKRKKKSRKRKGGKHKKRTRKRKGGSANYCNLFHTDRPTLYKMAKSLTKKGKHAISRNDEGNPLTNLTSYRLANKYCKETKGPDFHCPVVNGPDCQKKLIQSNIISKNNNVSNNNIISSNEN